MQPEELYKRIQQKKAPVVVDVRHGFEFNSGHVPGAVHAPTWKLLLRLVPLPADRAAELVVTCELGPRAQIAKGLLGLIGYRNVTLLDGHMSRWRKSGLPMEK